MAENVTLNNLANLQNDTTTINVINGNNATITAAFSDVLSRTGVSPNQMIAPLDMNNFPIMNLPAPGSANSPARLVDVTSTNPINISLSLSGDVTSPASSGVLTTTLAKTPLTSGNVLVANGSVWNSTAMTGDVSINSTGVTTLTNTGTTGHKVPFLDGNNTFSGTNTFSGASTFTANPSISTAAGISSLTVNPQAASQQANINLNQNGVAKWQIGKQTDDTFFIFDSVGAQNVATAKTGTGQGFFIKGTNASDNATAGFVGEYLSSTVLQASSVALTNNVAANVTSLVIPAGDWDVWANPCFIPGATTSITALSGYLSTVSATINPVTPFFYSQNIAAVVPNTNPQSFHIAPIRVSVGGNTTYFLVALALFTVSTLGGFGSIQARRVR